MILTLPANGIRLRFDGLEQRLRLVEILDFTKCRITYNDKDIAKPPSAQGSAGSPSAGAEVPSGPAFRNIYHRLFGPTYDGEYISNSDGTGMYVLSYPGVGFNFPLPVSSYHPEKDVVSLLSSTASQTAHSVAVFNGKSWAEARETLWTDLLPSIKSAPPFSKSKDAVPDEISLVKIQGAGRLQLFRKWTTNSFWIHLGETTPQDLVAELGPPDAIYRMNDQRMHIHKNRTSSHSRSRSSGGDYKRPDDLTDTDQSFVTSGSDDSADDEEVEEDAVEKLSEECFFNYFYHGFDIQITLPRPPSRIPPSQSKWDTDQLPGANFIKSSKPGRLVATKIVLHGNVPGSYPFNRHRRARWEIAYLEKPQQRPINSETTFGDIEKQLRQEWKSTYTSEQDAKQRQRGMVLNRGWGDSPGSSCEFLGGWEDNGDGVTAKIIGGRGGPATSTLYGFPGLVFEVLKNDYVSAVTVF